MSTTVITVGTRCLNHEVTQRLRQRRGVRVVVNESLQHCDFVSGVSSLLYYDIHSTGVQHHQAALVHRIQAARQKSGTQPVILMIHMETEAEVSLETLSWLNLECGVAEHCGLVLVWLVDDAVQYLMSLATSSVTSVEYSGAPHPQYGNAPLPVLIEALTQTPQVVTRNDVVRMANRKMCIADVITSEAAEWQDIPGLGHKKASRLQHIFRTPFLSSQQRVDSFLPATDESRFLTKPTAMPSHSLESTGEPVAQPSRTFSGSDLSTNGGRCRMMQALQQRLDAEDAESRE